MNNSERLIAALSAAPGPVCDDCASARASVLPRQQINQIANRLSAIGRIVRGRTTRCCYCKAGKMVSSVSATASNTTFEASVVSNPIAANPLPSSALQPATGGDATRPWHWEGNVQVALGEHLKSSGWTITAFADTGRKESGIDLAATRAGRALVVEVKGFPSTTYEHGERRGLSKPTQPTNQARQWYAHALLSVMRLLEKHPAAIVALCFPDFATYRKLIHATRTSLKTLGVGIYLVSPAGEVTEHVAALR